MPKTILNLLKDCKVSRDDYKSSDELRFTYNYFLVDPTQIQNKDYKDKVIL